MSVSRIEILDDRVYWFCAQNFNQPPIPPAYEVSIQSGVLQIDASRGAIVSLAYYSPATASSFADFATDVFVWDESSFVEVSTPLDAAETFFGLMSYDSCADSEFRLVPARLVDSISADLSVAGGTLYCELRSETSAPAQVARLPIDIVMGARDDLVQVDFGSVTVSGGGGRDNIACGKRTVCKISGGKGVDTIVTGNGPDTVDGGDSGDIISTRGGDDSIVGAGGNDLISGGEGNDLIHGGTDDDTLYGDAGNDWLWGDAGIDSLRGGDGNDRFSTGGDELIDRVFGGGGRDSIMGQTEDDLFVQ